VSARKLPYQHLSVRVPWHDTGWEGSVCADPLANGSCLRLGRIADERDDAQEARLAGRSWAELTEAGLRLPPCSAERAGLMSPGSRRVTKEEHPYAAWYEVYRKFRPTSYELPAYSADCIPFRWMLRESAAEISERYQLPYEAALEDAVDAEAGIRSTAWVQHGTNQRMLLDAFFSAIEKQRSLFFVYAKESPVSADPRRILIGVGRTLEVGHVVPYKQEAGGFPSVLWERVVRHSIRPAMNDGFLLPYQHLLGLADEAGIDPADYAVFVPDEAADEFSYASEHVRHDTAISLLLAFDRAVAKLAPLVPGSWDQVREWLSARLAEVWQARGPCPGLGAALTAFGISEGTMLAHAVQARVGDNEDPWLLADRWLRAPSSDEEASARVSPVMSKTWASLDDRRRALLRLLSRFDLTIDQATRFYQPTERGKAGIGISDDELLANPYLIYEHSRLSPDPVSVRIIDHGVLPEDRVRASHPLPAPTAVDDVVDPRRVRALVIGVLEDAAGAGDTLRSQARVIQEIRDQPLQPGCPISPDIMGVCAESLPPEVETTGMADGSAAYQLARLADARRFISRQVTRRRGAARLQVSADWRRAIDQALGGTSLADDGEEELARQEKAAALEMLATSRVSVLVGAAGTGKTTLLRALASLPEIAGGGLLLLAPTGKARVRMQDIIGRAAGTAAQTLAQLLVKTGRYNPDTGRYQRSDHDRVSSARTVIVDECSMLTEAALDALLDGVEGFDRLILVGDPRQLPPIGAGRPFVDIVQHLRTQCGPLGFPRVGPCYAELTVPRRPSDTAPSDERADLLLAEWFAGSEPSPAADEIWDQLGQEQALPSISVRPWSTPADLGELLRRALAEAIPEMSSADDCHGFQQSYGGTLAGGYMYFNLGAAASAETWQILSPVRASAGGVNEINRTLQRSYRASTRNLAENKNRYQRKIPRPAGPQEIIYGDKVINVRNKTRRHYHPHRPDVMEYVANGEIGVVTGPFKGRGQKKVPFDRLEVEFATQQGTAYKFWMSEMGGDDQAPILELAYAVTVHKAQGSEFWRTFVILPSPCRVMSRELLYTALTRQRDHVTLLTQGQLADLRQYASAAHSETASRITNLFAAPSPVEIDGRYLEAGLIHRTRKGQAVRSKSEVIIADLLHSKQIDYRYEQPLAMPDGSRRLPDFTITDDTTGTSYYWEHLGMLQRPSYRRQWQRKLAWYKSHGILPHDEGGGPNGTLIVTQDGDDGSISSAEIEALLDKLLT
jgi:hypothetical protein